MSWTIGLPGTGSLDGRSTKIGSDDQVLRSVRGSSRVSRPRRGISPKSRDRLLGWGCETVRKCAVEVAGGRWFRQLMGRALTGLGSGFDYCEGLDRLNHRSRWCSLVESLSPQSGVAGPRDPLAQLLRNTSPCEPSGCGTKGPTILDYGSPWTIPSPVNQ